MMRILSGIFQWSENPVVVYDPLISYESECPCTFLDIVITQWYTHKKIRICYRLQQHILIAECKAAVSQCVSNGDSSVLHIAFDMKFAVWCALPPFDMFILSITVTMASLIARFMGPTWGPSGAARIKVGTMLAPRTLLSGLTGSWPGVRCTNGTTRKKTVDITNISAKQH